MAFLCFFFNKFHKIYNFVFFFLNWSEEYEIELPTKATAKKQKDNKANKKAVQVVTEEKDDDEEDEGIEHLFLTLFSSAKETIYVFS